MKPDRLLAVIAGHVDHGLVLQKGQVALRGRAEALLASTELASYLGV